MFRFWRPKDTTPPPAPLPADRADRGRQARLRGLAAESLAADLLIRRGLRIVDRNYRCKGGEIDLVARDGDTLVFVEVRTRNSSAFGGAAASIGPRKQARLALAANHYLAAHRETAKLFCRFDCVLIDPEGQMEWIPDAFRLD